MKMKKIISYIVAFTMVVGTIGTNVLANPEEVTMNYTDYEPGEMPKNLIDNGTNRDIAAGSGEYYFGRNNGNVVRGDFTTVSPKVHHIKYAFNGSDTVTTLPAAWANMFKFDGFEINSSGTQGR